MEKGRLALVCFGLVLFVMVLLLGIQQYEIHRLGQVVEILGFEADAASSHMRDSNLIDMKIIKRLKVVETQVADLNVQ